MEVDWPQRGPLPTVAARSSPAPAP